MNASTSASLTHKTVENFANEKPSESRFRSDRGICPLAARRVLIADSFPPVGCKENLRAPSPVRANSGGGARPAGGSRASVSLKERTLSRRPDRREPDRGYLQEGGLAAIDYRLLPNRRRRPRLIRAGHGSATVSNGVKGGRSMEVQLPLWRAPTTAMARWAGLCVDTFPCPSGSKGIKEFAIDASLFRSAMSSAEAVADRAARICGRPEVRARRDYEDIFWRRPSRYLVKLRSF